MSWLFCLARCGKVHAAARWVCVWRQHETKKLGETLLVLLDRLDDLDKPALIAKVFRAYLERDLPFDTFRRLAAAIERLPVGSYEALQAFYSPNRKGIETGGEFLPQFASAGLAGIEFYPSTDMGGGYEPTELGKLLMSILDVTQ